MKQAFLSILVAAGILAIPALGLAATYQYVNVNGEIGSIEADTVAEAMMASDIAARSGVLLVTSPSTDIPSDTEVAL